MSIVAARRGFGFLVAIAVVLLPELANPLPVNAQSGKHIAAATAGQLVSEAQLLIANCR